MSYKRTQRDNLTKSGKQPINKMISSIKMIKNQTKTLELKKYICNDLISSVQSLSRVWPFVTPWTAAHQPSLAITNSQSLLKLMSIESVMPCNHLILCHPLLLLPSVFPSIRVFSNEFVFMYQVAKILELQHQSFQWIFRTGVASYDTFSWPDVQI